MWRIANGAVYPGMVHDVALNFSMVVPSVLHVSNSSECLTAQAATTGEGVPPRSSLSRKHDIGNVLTSNVSLCFVSEFKKLDPLAAEDAAVI